MKYGERDVNILALTVYGEARGEPREGKLGVAWSARNRAMADLWSDDRDDWWGEGIAGVCRRSWQYSCWNKPNQPQSQRERLEQFLVGNDAMHGILKPNARADDAIEAFWQVARAVLDGTSPTRPAGPRTTTSRAALSRHGRGARGRPCGSGATYFSTTCKTGSGLHYQRKPRPKPGLSMGGVRSGPAKRDAVVGGLHGRLRSRPLLRNRTGPAGFRMQEKRSSGDPGRGFMLGWYWSSKRCSRWNRYQECALEQARHCPRASQVEALSGSAAVCRTAIQRRLRLESRHEAQSGQCPTITR